MSGYRRSSTTFQERKARELSGPRFTLNLVNTPFRELKCLPEVHCYQIEVDFHEVSPKIPIITFHFSYHLKCASPLEFGSNQLTNST